MKNTIIIVTVNENNSDKGLIINGILEVSIDISNGDIDYIEKMVLILEKNLDIKLERVNYKADEYWNWDEVEHYINK